MDINEVLLLAKENERQMAKKRTIGYSTEVGPPRKLERNVDRKAIKALLNQRNETERMKKEARKKKPNLQQSQENENLAKKTKIMSTKLKVSSSKQECCTAHKKKPAHREDAKKPVAKIRSNNLRPTDEGGGHRMGSRKKKHKLQMNHSRAQSILNYSDLMNLAQKQIQHSSNETSKSPCSDAACNEKEKRKTNILEAELKELKNGKRSKVACEEISKSKEEKVKLLSKFNKKSQEKNCPEKNSSKQLDRRKDRNLLAYKNFMISSKDTSYSSKTASKAPRSDSQFLTSTHNQEIQNSLKSVSSSKSSNPKDRKKNLVVPKKISNPYAEFMQKAKADADTSNKCTLSIQSDEVRTNYPGVSMTDPKNPTYHRVKASARTLVAVKRNINSPGVYRRPRMFPDDDEDDAEMDGFIDDNEQGLDSSISAQIGAIFGYNKFKYSRESEYELSRMDASFKDIEREEKRSLRIAQQEDAREARLEEERKKRR